MGGDCSQKLLLRRGSHSSPGRSRSSDHYSIAKIGCPRARRSGLLFSPTRGLCAFRRSVNIVSFETSSARLVFSPPLLSRGGVVPAGPPKWLPPWPPLTRRFRSAAVRSDEHVLRRGAESEGPARVQPG